MSVPLERHVTLPLYDVIAEVQLRAAETADTAKGCGNVLVLTPNRRLATRLSLTDDLAKAQQLNTLTSPSAWQTLTIEPWESWIGSLWEQWQLRHWWSQEANESQATQQLLTPLQEQLIWEQVIRSSSAGERLLRPAATARLIQDAESLLDHYLTGLTDDEQSRLAQHESDCEDVHQFYQWSERFRNHCAEGGWLSPGKMLGRLIDLDLQAQIANYSTILLYGFRYFSPLEQQFLDSLSVKYNVGVHSIEPNWSPAPTTLYPCRDRQSEYEEAVAWAWALLNEKRVDKEGVNEKDAHSNLRIGIVVPTLEQDRALIQRLFIQHCWPDRITAAADDHDECVEAALNVKSVNPVENEKIEGEEWSIGKWVNISGGIPIWQTPVLQVGLELLSLLKSPVNLVTVCRLLRSPFVGGAERETFTREQWERQLRKRQIEQFSLTALGNWCEKAARPLPDFNERLKSAQAFINSDKSRIHTAKSLSVWATIFQQWLQLWGWPGERTLSSLEYQMHSKWFECLEQFIALQAIADPPKQYTLSEALSVLRQSGEGMTYQAQSDDAPIQVLGLLEADGQQFDYLWVSGLQADTWPQAIKPNPFLPAALQRQKLMPHASAERELALAKAMLHDFQKAADRAVIFSWPQQEEDREVLPSPVLRLFREEGDRPTAGRFSNPMASIAGSVELQYAPERTGPSLPSGKRVAGGTQIVRDQGACPFKAFSRYRLRAREMEASRLGFSPAERGDAVHYTLQHFWNETEDQATLAALALAELERLIAHSATKAMQMLLGERQQSFSEHFLALETQRLIQLTTTWLEHEKQRTPFKVVSVEQEQIEIIDDLEMRLRIDRIDQIGENQFLIIDYKTGRAKVAQWLDEGLEEPQLPLYCITSSYQVYGIAFGEVKADRSRLSALVRDDAQLFNKRVRHVTQTDDWHAITAQWREIIAQRVKAFREGVAVVDPRDPASTCRYCPYPTLCRIGERDQRALEIEK